MAIAIRRPIPESRSMRRPPHCAKAIASTPRGARAATAGTRMRDSSRETLLGMEDIVLRGTRAKAGMPSFGRYLNARQVVAIRAFVVSARRASSPPQ
jgi:hypothetical protein